MPLISRRVPKPLFAIASALIGLAPLGCAHAQPAADTAAPPSEPQTSMIAASRQIQELAEEGRFDQLLESVRLIDSPDITHLNLTADLESYRDGQDMRAASRAELLEEALTKMREAVESNDLEGALVAAIDAETQSMNPEFKNQHPEVRDLITQAQEAGEEAEQSGDWLRAVSLYRLLDLMFDVDTRYSDNLNRSLEHVRVIQMYAPEQFQAMAETRRAELAANNDDDETNDTPEDIATDIETWQTRLRDIDDELLYQALRDSVRHHITGPQYASMLQGSIEQLLVLLNTPEAAESFTMLEDVDKRDRFITFLQDLNDDISQPDTVLNWSRTRTCIQQIVSTNDMTVQLPENVLFYELCEGATDTTDTFSYVIWPEDTSEFLSRTMQGKFYGVGIQIAREDGQLTVISPLANTPAQRAGVRAGDVITSVDGRSTATWSLTRAVREITGEEGTSVELGLERLGEEDAITVNLTREEIPIDSIRGWQINRDGTWNYWVDENAGIGYIRVSQFIEQTVPDLDAAIRQMQSEHELQGLVLDLRFNPGGLMESAVQMVDRFIDEGPIVSTVNAAGRRIPGSLRQANDDTTYEPFPLVVLVNQGSASASEIVSGALQDHHRAFIIGERSYGKGSVQQVSWYPNRFNIQWGVKITTSHYALPSGRIIHREEDSTDWGINPDLVVDMTEREIADELEVRRDADVIHESDEDGVDANDRLTQHLDPQLESAIIVLKSQILAENLEIAALENSADTP